MTKNFGAPNWREYIPQPICDEHPEYLELYNKAWELAFEHIKNIPGMPQNPDMDMGHLFYDSVLQICAGNLSRN